MLPRRVPSRGPSLWSERYFAKEHGVEISCSAPLRRASVRSRLACALHRPAGHDPLAPRSGALSLMLIKPCSAAIGGSDWGCPPPDPAGRTTGKHYAARYAVGCHLLYSDIRFPPRYTLHSFWEK